MKKVGQMLVALSLGIAAGLPFTTPVTNALGKKAVREYVESNLPKIMHEQEEKLGIRYTGAPNVAYEKAEQVDGEGMAGMYLPGSNTIFLLPEKIDVPGKSIRNSLLRKLNLAGPRGIDIKRVIDHELGHFYVDQASINRGHGSWPGVLSEKDGPYSGISPQKSLIGEGIAEYFARATNNCENTGDSEIDFGYSLVAPIIKKYGNKGIECLVDNPPSLEEYNPTSKMEIRKLQNYQTRISGLLAK